MMNRLRAAWLRWRLGVTPEDHLLADYEALVRLARRCAYDFRHASDYVQMPDYLSDINYRHRADMWTKLFGKGNPGKDYRNRCALNMAEANERLEILLTFVREQGLKLPDELERRIGNDIPF